MGLLCANARVGKKSTDIQMKWSLPLLRTVAKSAINTTITVCFKRKNTLILKGCCTFVSDKYSVLNDKLM